VTTTQEQKLIALCAVEELMDGAVHAARAGRARLGVVQDRGTIKVFFGGCPHHGGPLDCGRVRPSITASKPGERILLTHAPVLICPWHSYEFDLTTGRAVADRRLRLRFIAHEIHDGKVCVQWPPKE
jgi:nitrite reductase/ring-hydroxylating ferredoxin subunit